MTHDVAVAITAHKRSQKGSWPVLGGWLDQANVALQAIEFTEKEFRKFKALAEDES